MVDRGVLDILKFIAIATNRKQPRSRICSTLSTRAARLSPAWVVIHDQDHLDDGVRAVIASDGARTSGEWPWTSIDGKSLLLSWYTWRTSTLQGASIAVEVDQRSKAAVTSPNNPLENQILASLPPQEWARWVDDLESVDLPLGMILYESGATMTHVYFPTTAIVSLLYVLDSGASAEMAVVGNEGIVGVSLFMGGGSTPSRAVVQSAGRGFRLASDAMKKEFDRTGPVLHVLLRYTQALITQMAQTAVCNRHHSIDQQLCRWLLLSLDRLSSDELDMTQELIGNMLGVRREGVTEAATKLQRAGLIKYYRGHIAVLDRPGIERRSCECYGVVKTEYDRLLPRTSAI